MALVILAPAVKDRNPFPPIPFTCSDGSKTVLADLQTEDGLLRLIATKSGVAQFDLCWSDNTTQVALHLFGNTSQIQRPHSNIVTWREQIADNCFRRGPHRVR